MRDRLIHEPRAVARIRVHHAAESQSASGALDKIATVDQFSDYCKRVVGGVAPLRGHMAEFERTLAKYRVALRSHWWLAAAWAAADESGQLTAEQARVLRTLVRSDPNSFSPRVRMSDWLARVTGFDLEDSMFRELGVFPFSSRGRPGQRRFSIRRKHARRPL
jgi:hypothetical protein